MNKKEKSKDKATRYSNSVIFYKSLSCKVSLYEDRLISEYCSKNKLSKSLFLATAAMYCVKNNISRSDLLNSTTTSENFDFRDYMEDEYDE
ncbi:hypothetical protein [Ruminococcus flavefaciens]|uniref:Uncharacterized protein n=1 Tax=Ruminococcus flavefaciens TaxID=1265 RepID=A0A1M7H7N6_RUMFL|nr:hypothetical protein [Ruminococcus flavefaciens]SHM24097.1 hypothetical protein SAMN04487860_102149 [Ruminococcus flavefaciens]